MAITNQVEACYLAIYWQPGHRINKESRRSPEEISCCYLRYIKETEVTLFREIGGTKMSLTDEIITEWGYNDWRFEDAKKEIFDIYWLSQISLSDARGLLNRVLLDIETKNIVNMWKQ